MSLYSACVSCSVLECNRNLQTFGGECVLMDMS